MARRTFGLLVSPFPRRLPRVLLCLLGAVAMLHGADAAAVSFDVTIGTGALSGTPATLEITLLAGDDTDGNNTATLTLFATDGVLGAATSTPNVTGSLPAAVTMDESDGLGQVLQDITLGTSITFRVDLTTSFAGGLDFDRFDVFLLDPLTSFTLVDTPLDGDALLRIALVGPPDGTAVSASNLVTISSSVVPEPGAALLVLVGLPALLLRRRRHPQG